MRVLRVDAGFADCSGRHGAGRIDLSLVGEVAPGAWLLTWLGAARSLLDETEAQRVELALDALNAAQSSPHEPFDVARFFPDLVDRETQLPPHLQEKR